MRKSRKEYPDPPFITSTLQQDAYNKLGMTAAQTMKHAQELYENGFITYMRTDSTRLSATASKDIKEQISRQYGPEYYQCRDHSKQIKNAQEAHEAIRPTHVSKPEADIVGKLSAKHGKLYEMILKKTLASQMKEAVYDDLLIQIVDSSFRKRPELYFQCKVSILKYPGFTILNQASKNEKGAENSLGKIEKLLVSGQTTVSCSDVVAHNVWSAAPSRYNEPLLIKVLEKEGIGRPSTYASIMSKLFTKQYISKENIEGLKHNSLDLVWISLNGNIKETKGVYITNAENSRLVSTEVGKIVNEYMEREFDDIVSMSFTAEMEDQLDDVANGKIGHSHVLHKFWDGLKGRVAQQTNIKLKKQTIKTEQLEFTINNCTYVVRLAKYGPVIEYGEKKFIGLKPYLTMTRKAYPKISENEVRFLAGFPYKIADSNGSSSAEVAYGQYGFFVKLGGQTAPVTKYWLKANCNDITDLKSITLDQVVSVIEAKEEYKKNTKKKKTKSTKM